MLNLLNFFYQRMYSETEVPKQDVNVRGLGCNMRLLTSM